MNGMNYLFESQSIPKNLGAARAINDLKSLNLSLDSMHNYMLAGIEKQDGVDIELPADETRAYMTLAYMVQTSIRNNLQTFSLDAFNEMKERANGITVYGEELSPLNSVTIEATDESNPALVDIEPKVSTPKTVKTLTTKAQDDGTPAVKGTRGRKYDPNSAVHKIKPLFDEAPDKSREAIIALFVKELGIPAGTAMAYYYKARQMPAAVAAA